MKIRLRNSFYIEATEDIVEINNPDILNHDDVLFQIIEDKGVDWVLDMFDPEHLKEAIDRQNEG